MYLLSVNTATMYYGLTHKVRVSIHVIHYTCIENNKYVNLQATEDIYKILVIIINTS